ncbi:MAG TPA: DUF4145 domain-containing protein [Thermoguttaceae bacterium]
MNNDERVIIDCTTCSAKVQASIVGKIWLPDDPSHFGAYLFLRCLSCGNPSVMIADRLQVGDDDFIWDGKKLWPSVDEIDHPSIPKKVSKDLLDAKKCFDAGVYSASVVMCGRALEGVVREKTNEINLFKGLGKLKEMQIIDERLFNWSELLRKERNLGAHSSEEEITKDNARDLYDFAIALCEFIYVLTDKYNAFVERKEIAKKL